MSKEKASEYAARARMTVMSAKNRAETDQIGKLIQAVEDLSRAVHELTEE